MELFKQKLKGGVYVGYDFTAPVDPKTGKHPVRQFERGETVYAETDLAAAEPQRWAPQGERARSRVAVPQPGEAKAATGATLSVKDKVDVGVDREDLEQMTVAELRELAAAKGVQLHGAHRKDDVIEALLAGDPAASDDGATDEE